MPGLSGNWARTMTNLKSKKFIAMVIGTSLTTVFTFAGLLAIHLNPEASAATVNLITISLTTVNGSVGIYAIGQSAVDWKINSQ
jgi:hypothetical protein